ncbi:methyltransferase family protein [Gemmatimonadota bacterium]
MGIRSLFHASATGSRRRQRLLTPIGLLFFAGTLFVVITGGLALDRLIPVQRFLPRKLSTILGLAFIIPGLFLSGTCVIQFLKANGTPVPFNPPGTLIITGLYLWIRNPMLTGVFAWLFGTGLLLQSFSIVLITTPLYIIAHIIELKRVEEPELEQRFGVEYTEYRQRVPMFIPRLGRS